MTTFTLSRPDVSRGCVTEYEAFASLVESLNDEEWNAPSRCAGWLVRDVAGHVIGLAEDTAAGVPGSRNSDEEAASVRYETALAAAARLRKAIATTETMLGAVDDAAWNGPIGVADLSLGDGVLTLWYDAFLHGDDIRAAVGKPSERGPGLAATIAYLAGALTKKKWGPATLELDGVPRYDVGRGGRVVTGDPLQFALVATGRADAQTMDLDPDVSIY